MLIANAYFFYAILCYFQQTQIHMELLVPLHGRHLNPFLLGGGGVGIFPGWTFWAESPVAAGKSSSFLHCREHVISHWVRARPLWRGGSSEVLGSGHPQEVR